MLSYDFLLDAFLAAGGAALDEPFDLVLVDGTGADAAAVAMGLRKRMPRVCGGE